MIVALGALVVAVGGVAVTSIADGGGVIHACYNNQNGRVRLADTDDNKPKNCSNRETAITWNQIGPPGPASPATYSGPHWGIITRNTIGSAVADLRSGPFGSIGVSGPTASPPHGDGSLGIEVNDVSGKVEKAAFGNEVDFFGDEVLDIDDVGFSVFQTEPAQHRVRDRSEPRQLGEQLLVDGVHSRRHSEYQ